MEIIATQTYGKNLVILMAGVEKIHHKLTIVYFCEESFQLLFASILKGDRSVINGAQVNRGPFKIRRGRSDYT
jgi:hypothetical protein